MNKPINDDEQSTDGPFVGISFVKLSLVFIDRLPHLDNLHSRRREEDVVDSTGSIVVVARNVGNLYSKAKASTTPRILLSGGNPSQPKIQGHHHILEFPFTATLHQGFQLCMMYSCPWQPENG